MGIADISVDVDDWDDLAADYGRETAVRCDPNTRGYRLSASIKGCFARVNPVIFRRMIDKGLIDPHGNVFRELEQ